MQKAKGTSFMEKQNGFDMWQENQIEVGIKIYQLYYIVFIYHNILYNYTLIIAQFTL